MAYLCLKFEYGRWHIYFLTKLKYVVYGTNYVVKISVTVMEDKYLV